MLLLLAIPLSRLASLQRSFRGMATLKTDLSSANPVYKMYIKTCQEGTAAGFLPHRLPFYFAGLWVIMIAMLVVHEALSEPGGTAAGLGGV